MKKIALSLVIASTILVGCKNEEKKDVNTNDPMDEMVSDVVDDHNSQNALDWAGVYEGTTPCADCEGIKTVLELNDDNTYILSQTYLGKPDADNEFKNETKGTFTWNDAGSNITLKDGDRGMQLKVGENQLMMLDSDGNMVEGNMSDLYILKKKV